MIIHTKIAIIIKHRCSPHRKKFLVVLSINSNKNNTMSNMLYLMDALFFTFRKQQKIQIYLEGTQGILTSNCFNIQEEKLLR